MIDKPHLDGAYNLQSTEDHLRLYRDWAETYDVSFGAAHDYQQPELVAKAFVENGGKGPVLDVGAGTGLVGEALAKLGIRPLDATDLSKAMLDVAKTKGVYENLFSANLLEGLPVENGFYRGITCAGTFTFGHLGPEALPELLRVAAPGAVFSLSINQEHYHAAGFEDAFEVLSDKIANLTLKTIRIYGDRASGEHAQDTSLIACFSRR